ncbi:GTP cyclohydrolase II [Pseudobacteriovorax antillogorgiicola]|uniref:GTP cyclohydrolase-2 n=1 Tax=Pseudobacteriovorax antillogorgiicola TaxID=1513793 RepID=A0A1Y6BND0_9BACT|nr:GTP cyclohydrolase II [Pseudobacteriovorax antillogorgiicola]TCS53887.1 GTP cyclohydrolase II [Pseudobacteriovorax antillogorgiicola]SMF20965.1 GTP cyclohydrolase II [Pseudobacteriovorax antillogorgiicola]
MQSPSPLEVSLFSEALVPTVYGEFLVSVYKDNQSEDETVLISHNLSDAVAPFIRVHSECFTGEVLGSLKCDCRDQLALSLKEIQKRGSGAVIYLRQEGRGIGLGNKIKAYDLQNKGADTIEANHMLGFGTDLRTFDRAALILKDRSIDKIVLNTNNPEKLESLKNFGIEITERVPSLSAVNEHNKDYLETKMKLLGHHLDPLF